MEQSAVARPPARVEALAAARGLGNHALTRKGENPVAMFLGFGVVGVVLIGVSMFCGWLAGKTEISALAVGAVLAVLAGLLAIGLGFFELFKGFRVTYLYDGGLVWTRNGRAQVATWAEVDRLTVLSTSPEKRPHLARVTTLDGRHVPVAMEWTDDADPVHARLVHVFRTMGRPVHDSDPPPWEGPETNLDDSTVTKIGAIFGVVGGLALSFTLDIGVGLTLGLALALGFLAVAVVLLLAGYLVDQRSGVIGVVFLGLVCVILLIDANHVVKDHYILVTGATLALEAAVVAVGIGVYRRIPAPRRFGRRRRIAATRGWRFMPEVAVPVGGPVTATRLIGVPTQASGTTGEGTVTATANGLTCVAYDRARRRPRLTDQVQTAWTVFLPAPLPYITKGDVERVRSGMPGDHPVHPLAHLLAGVPSPNTVWWIEGGYLYGVEERPARAELVADRIEQLTRFAAQIPWQHITPA